MRRKIRLALLTLGFLMGSGSAMGACTALPNSLTNGQVADASQVMANFNSVNNCLQQSVTTTGAPITGSIAVFSGSGTISTGDLTGDVTTAGGTSATLSISGVTAGSYSNANIIVDAKGRITAASNGSSSGLTVTTGGDLTTGWRKYSDGWIEEWGEFSDGDQDVSFPIPFLQQVVGIDATCVGSTSTDTGLGFSFHSTNLTLSSFHANPRYFARGDSNIAPEIFRWFARGK